MLVLYFFAPDFKTGLQGLGIELLGYFFSGNFGGSVVRSHLDFLEGECR